MSVIAVKLIEDCIKYKDAYLYLGNCDLSDEDFIEGSYLDKLLRSCTHLTSLVFSNEWKDFDVSQHRRSLNKGGNNYFSHIPQAVFSLQQLTSLTFAGDKNARWGINSTAYFGNFSKLLSLDLSYNSISQISGLEKLTSLQLLYLGHNYLNNLKGIDSLKSLHQLYANANAIDDMTGIELLPFLHLLYLSYNKISNLKTLIPFLKNKEFSFNINTEQKELYQKSIYLSNNPLTTPPPEVIQQGLESIINYFTELEQQGIDYLYEAKMLIVGQPRAGKTTLRYKLHDVTSPLPDEDKTTRGIDIERLSFEMLDKEGKVRNFHCYVWDFGGQQIYQTTHQFFLTQRSLYILVADTGKDSIGNDDSTINYWLQVVEVLGDNSPLMLVLNEKSFRKVNLDLSQKKKRFSFFKQDYDTDLNALIPNTPSFDEDKLRDFYIFKENIELELKRLPLVGFPMPKNWVQIREKLQLLSKEKPYIYRQDFISICESYGVSDFEKQMELSRIFHDLGVFLHFQDIDTLEEFIILQNTWATDAVFAVLDHIDVKTNKGKFTDQELSQIWKNKGYHISVYKKLLSLMMRFELCYQVNTTNPHTYIIPEMLPSAPISEYSWNYNNDLPLQYKYDFMPKGLLTRLIVRLNKYIDTNKGQQIVWKTGVKINGGQLGYRDTFAEITEAWDSKQIYVRVNTLSKNVMNFNKELMTVITFEIDKLNDEFFKSKLNLNELQKSKWYKLIPCNCKSCQSDLEKHFFDIEELNERKSYGKNQIECKKRPYLTVEIDDLFNGVFAKKANDSSPKKLFISYSNLDRLWKDKLIKHLAPLKNQNLISLWYDKNIEDGVWEKQIEDAMENCDVFVLLITPNFLSSRYITSKEVNMAYSRYKKGESKIFPILCDSCDWKDQPFTNIKNLHNSVSKSEAPILLGSFQAFPKNGKPIKNWNNQNDGFLNVIDNLKKSLRFDDELDL